MGELVLTNFNRLGFPVIRYRTGDLVRLSEPKPCVCGRTFRTLLGGILARADDMMIIRGVNVYPSAIEAVLRDFKEVLAGQWEEVTIPLEAIVDPEDSIISGIAFQNMGASQEIFFLDDIRLTP